MDMSPRYLTGGDAGEPSKVEIDQFLKKFKLLTKAELEAILRVSPEEFGSVLNQIVPCVGCRRSAEAVFQKYQEGPNYGFYPLCMNEKGMLYLAKDRISPQFLCTMFRCPTLKVQKLIDSLGKCKSGRRCSLHSLESQKIRTVSSWVEVCTSINEKSQQQDVSVDSKCLIETLERYLKKHRFGTEYESKVWRAYKILTGELNPASEPGFIEQLYDGIESCKEEDQHLQLICKTEVVTRLIPIAVPEFEQPKRRKEFNKEEQAKQERKEHKKVNRRRKKEKKSGDNSESVVEDAATDEVNETLEESAEPVTEEGTVEGAQEQEVSCQCGPVETAPRKTRKNKKSGRGKNKTNASCKELPLSQVANGVVTKSEPTPQEDTESRIVPGPYRSLMEQLEDGGLSDNEEESDWVPPEISAIQSASWTQEREQLRETLKMKFQEMLSKRKTGCFRQIGCNEQQHAADRICADCCEKDENRPRDKSADDGNPQKDSDTSSLKKSTRPGNNGGKKKVNGGRGGQYIRRYKGKNRR